MERRQFLRTGAGWIVVANGTALLVTACGGGGGGNGNGGGEHVFTSTVDQGHSHTFVLNDATLESPPSGGIQDSTSVDGGHAHGVSLTQTQLQQIQAGTAVTVTSTNVSGHTHDFTFQVASFAELAAARRAGWTVA